MFTLATEGRQTTMEEIYIENNVNLRCSLVTPWYYSTADLRSCPDFFKQT